MADELSGMSTEDLLRAYQAAPTAAAPSGGDLANVSTENLLRAYQSPPEDVTAGMALSGIPVLGAYVPQAEAAIRAAAQPLTGVGAPGASYAERYAANLPERQAQYAQAQQESPLTSAALQIGGGTAALAPLGATALGARALGMAGSLPARLAASTASGAGISAADALARGEDPYTAGFIGGGTGAIAPAAGYAIGRGVEGARSLFGRTPQVTTDIAGIKVPLSYGQATGQAAAQMTEQAARRGASGAEPERLAKAFFEGEQAPSVEQARAAIGAQLDRFGQPIVTTPQEAADLAGEQVRRAEAASKQGYRDLYAQAYAQPGEFAPGTFSQIGQSVRQRLSAGTAPIIVDQQTTPVAMQMLRDVDQTLGMLPTPNAAMPTGAAYPPANLAALDQARKRLVSIASGAERGSADQRAARGVINAFDGHVEDALTAGLFSGTDQAADLLKQARAAYSGHQALFTSRGAGDQVGKAMEQIVGRNGQMGATPTEIGNFLYGQARVGGTGLSVRLADRMQNILGQDSPEWAAIRQGLWARLTAAPAGTPQPGPQAVASRISEFLNGSGKPLAQSMFTPDEHAMMNQYAGLMRTLTPAQGAVNTSNTAGVLMQLGQKISGTLLGAIGGALGIGGPIGAAIGGGLSLVGKALESGQRTRNLERALRGYGPLDHAFAQQMQNYGARAALGSAPTINQGLAPGASGLPPLYYSEQLPAGLTQQDVNQALYGPGWENIPGSPEFNARQTFYPNNRVNPAGWDAFMASGPLSTNIEDRRRQSQ